MGKLIFPFSTLQCFFFVKRVGRDSTRNTQISFGGDAFTKKDDFYFYFTQLVLVLNFFMIFVGNSPSTMFSKLLLYVRHPFDLLSFSF